MLELPSRNIWSAYTQAGFKATSTEYMLYLVQLLYSTTSCSLTGENTIKPRSFQTTSSDAFPSHFTSTQSVRMTKCTTGKQILYIQILCIRATRCQKTFQDKLTTFLCIFYDNAPKIHLQLGQCVMVGRPGDLKPRPRQRERGAAGKGPT